MSNAGQDTETVFLGLTLKHSKVHTIGESICNAGKRETVKNARKCGASEKSAKTCTS